MAGDDMRPLGLVLDAEQVQTIIRGVPRAWEQAGRMVAGHKADPDLETVDARRQPTAEELVDLLAQVQVTDRCCCGSRAHAGHPCTLGAEGARRVVAALTGAVR